MASKKHNANLKLHGKRNNPNRTRQVWDPAHRQWQRVPESFITEPQD
jgi:hypothetical protein